MRVTGIEPDALIPESVENTRLTGGSASGVSTKCPKGTPDSQSDPDLAAVVAAWESLPAPMRAGIVAIVRAALPISLNSCEHGRRVPIDEAQP